MNPERPLLCIYHADCLDGFTAAWVVHSFFGLLNKLSYYPAQYGQQPPIEEARDKHVLIVDFSYPYDQLIELDKVADSVTVLDHHKTAAEDLTQLPDLARSHWSILQQGRKKGLIGSIHALFDMERSGAGITWDFFYPNTPRPALVNHVEDRDLWRFALPGTRDIMSSVSSYAFDFGTWDVLANCDPEELQSEGRAISRKRDQDIANFRASAEYRMVIDGYEVPVLNAPPSMISEAAGAMAEGFPFAACYWDGPDGRTFSLRSREGGVDVSEIAKRFGGGGHTGAAGFKLTHWQVARFPFGPFNADLIQEDFNHDQSRSE